MMNKRKKMMELAALTLSMGSMLAANQGLAAPKKGQKPVECFGVNTCKGSNACGVTKKQIETANKIFKDQYTKSKPIECAGNSDCGAKQGFLAWVSKTDQGECLSSGGFIFEKDANGQLVVRDKSGQKKSS